MLTHSPNPLPRLPRRPSRPLRQKLANYPSLLYLSTRPPRRKLELAVTANSPSSPLEEEVVPGTAKNHVSPLQQEETQSTTWKPAHQHLPHPYLRNQKATQKDYTKPLHPMQTTTLWVNVAEWRKTMICQQFHENN